VCWESTEGSSSSSSSTADAAASEPFGRLAAHAALHLLFLPGFTVDPKAFDAAPKASRGPEGEQEGDLVCAVRHPGAVWAPGVGGIDEGAVARSNTYDKNRIEVSKSEYYSVCHAYACL